MLFVRFVDQYHHFLIQTYVYDRQISSFGILLQNILQFELKIRIEAKKIMNEITVFLFGSGTPVQSRYIMETITMTTVTERRLVREVEDSSPVDTSPSPSIQSGGGLGSGSPISGILKGGKLWKQQNNATDCNGGTGTAQKTSDNTQVCMQNFC